MSVDYIYFLISSIFNALIITISGLYVLYKNPKSKPNKIFALFCLVAGEWAWTYIFWPLAQNKEDALFWFRVLHIGAIFVSITYLHFTIEWLNLYQKNKKLLIFGYFLAFFFLLFVFSPYFIKDMVPKFSMRYWAEPGILYHFYLMMFFGLAIYSWYLLFVNYLREKGIKKQQIKYVLLGIVISYLGASTNYPLWYNINIPPYGNILSSFFVLTTAYAIVKYRLMDINLVVGKTAVYLFSFITVIALAFILFYLNTKLTVPLPIYFTGPFIIVISILLFQFFFKLYEKLASRYFYYIFYSYQKVLTDLGKNLVKVLDLKELSSLIVQTLIETMKLDKTVILLREEKTKNYQILKNIGFKEENGISLVKDNFLTQYLEKTQKPLIFEELSLIIRDNKDKNEREKFENLKIHMKNIEAAVCLPLLIERKIIGLIVLGNKLNGESYSKEDIELLISLANQSSIALYNAKLYSQVQDLSKNLEERVKEQVKQIEELSEMKSEFLKIVNHQLRTPTSIINGFLSMLVEGSIKDEDKIKETLKKTYITVQRLNTILDDLLNAQELVGEKPILNLKPTKIEEIIERLIIHFQFIAQQKNLNLSFEKPKIALPTFLLDQERIERALSKIIDNAILYTEEGGVTISVQVFKKGKNNFLEIKIKDTGIGLTPEDKNKIFKIFSRGEGIKLHPNGSGLGLYIAKEYIEAHQGKIEAESEGKNRGSTFIITLPAITEV